jgi:hypothetical protein
MTSGKSLPGSNVCFAWAVASWISRRLGTGGGVGVVGLVLIVLVVLYLDGGLPLLRCGFDRASGWGEHGTGSRASGSLDKYRSGT